MHTPKIAIALFGLCVGASTIAQDVLKDDGIPPQALQAALEQFADRSGLQVIYLAELVRGKNSQGANPNLSHTETLQELLANSGLTYKFLNADTVTVQTRFNEAQDPGNQSAAAPPKVMAQTSENAKKSPTSGQRKHSQTQERVAKIDSGEDLPEIVVTGSNIRGVVPDSSPMIRFTREDIENSNYLTVPEFLASIPQNHTGGATQATFRTEAAEGTASNRTGGSGVNLRGLGSSSTLVLVNGRRFVPAGNGSIVDVSMIPLNLVDRIEILTDGASSLYGSDAIGGVVNLILRDDFVGSETVVQYGNVTSGDSEEVQASHLFGHRWGSGHANISYEYYDRGPLDANDRSFSEGAREPYKILPGQTRHTAFFSFEQEVTSRFGLFGHIVYSRRDTVHDWYEFQTLSLHSDSETEQQNVTIGGRLDLWDDWQIDFSGTYGESSSEVLSFTRSDGMLSEFGGSDSQFDIAVFDVKMDGTLFQLPGGNAAKLAFGAQYQDIAYETIPIVDAEANPFESSRDVTAVFSELYLPFVGEQNARAGLQRLELSLSGRYEDYSDFGSELTPKIGVLFAPSENLNLRATWGESFRAPILSDKSNLTSQGFLVDNSFLQNFPDPFLPPDLEIPLSLVAFGSNPDLDSESAKTWTVGLDYQPAFAPMLNVNVTYYDVEYDGRIEDAFAPHFLQPFFDPRWAPLISLNPDPDFMVFLMNQPFSFNLTETGDPADTVAFVDQRKQNFATVETSGIDLNLEYDVESGDSTWAFSFNATYILDMEKQLLETLDPFSILNTTYNPTDLKARGGISWRRAGKALNLFVNYTDDYIDNRELGFESTGPRDVASWTTVDAVLSYSPTASGGFFEGTRFALNVSNLFDIEPPFLLQPRTAVNYDPANASPLGRFIALSVRKSW